MEEMNYVFGVSTRRHVDYQIREVAPWCVDHYIKRKKGVKLEPLYRWQKDRDDEEANGMDNEHGEVHELGRIRTE